MVQYLHFRTLEFPLNDVPKKSCANEWQWMAEWHVLSEWQRPLKGGLDEQKPTGSWPQLIPSVQSHEASYYSIPPKQVQGCLSQECFNTSDKEHLFFLAWAWTARNVCSVGYCVDTYIIIYTMHIPKNMYSRLKRAWALQQDQQLQLVSFSRVWIRGGICSLIII